MIKRNQHNAFSIIELSLVISFMSMLAVSYLSLMTSASISDGQKQLITLKKMQTIEKAILNFTQNRTRLPCPALATGSSYTVTSSNNFGISYTAFYDDEYLFNSYYPSASLQNGAECWQNFGAVPTRALGIATDNMYDGWGRKFAYYVSPALCGKNTLSTKTCTPKDYASNEGNITVSTGTAGSGTVYTTSAAYALISYGADGYGSYTSSGVSFQSSSGNSTTANTLEQQNACCTNASNQLAFVNSNLTNIVNYGFDDIVSFKTKSQIGSMSTTLAPYCPSASSSPFAPTGASSSCLTGSSPKLPVTIYNSGNPVLNLVSLSSCLNNSVALASITNSIASTIRSTITQTRSCNGGSSCTNATAACTKLSSSLQCAGSTCPCWSNNGDEAVLDIMWVLQEACTQYYGSFTGYNSCPGGGVWDISSNVTNYGTCTCSNLNWTGSGC